MLFMKRLVKQEWTEKAGNWSIQDVEVVILDDDGAGRVYVANPDNQPICWEWNSYGEGLPIYAAWVSRSSVIEIEDDEQPWPRPTLSGEPV